MKIPPAEWKRKAVHAGMGLAALTLRWIDWRVAALLALGALLFNLFAMPRIGRDLYRDARKHRDIGIVAYPAVVLVLIVLFRHNLYIVAAVWAMMAFGDPAAAVAGRLSDGPRLAWNREKSWDGLVADWLVGGLCAVLVSGFVSGRAIQAYSVLILVLGAAVYAFLETVRAGVDDNLVAGLPTALVLLQLADSWGRSGSVWAGHRAPSALTQIAIIAVNAVVALVAWKINLVSRSGAVAGAVAGSVIGLFGGWGAYAVLWAFFLVGTAATKWGYRRKAGRGVAQSDLGRRGAAHVVANVGVAAVLLIIGARPIAFVAALAAALADTLGTEIGGLYGRRPFSLVRLSGQSAGTPGAVSAEGLAAGLLGAAGVGLVAAACGLLRVADIPIVTVAGFIGSLAESLAHELGRERGLRLDHEFANAFNTFIGAIVALEIVLSIQAHRLYLPIGGA